MSGNQQKDRSFFPQENTQDKSRFLRTQLSAGLRRRGRRCRAWGRSRGLNAVSPPPSFQRPASRCEALTLPCRRRQEQKALGAHLPTHLQKKALAAHLPLTCSRRL